MGGFRPVVKLLLGGGLQSLRLDEETARQILALVRDPVTTVAHGRAQPSTSGTWQESVMGGACIFGGC